MSPHAQPEPLLGRTESFRPRLGVELKSFESGAVVLDMSTGAIFELNRIGAEVWGLICGGTSVGRACEIVAERYAVETPRVEGDVRRLVAQLLAANLIVRS